MGDHADCGCDGECTCGRPGADAPAFSPFVYAIGHIRPVASSLGLEKELAQTLGRQLTAETDLPKLRTLLSKREHRYLVRNLRWVLQIDGADAYALTPSDPADFELLLDAVENTRAGEGLNLVVGLRAGNDVAAVVFDNIYSFTRAELVKSIGSEVSDAVVDAVLALTRNLGASAGDRAVNYLAVRYSDLYAAFAERVEAGSFLSGVESRPIASAQRDVVDVLFSFTNRTSGVRDVLAARVDVTEEFPFLVRELAPHVALALR